LRGVRDGLRARGRADPRRSRSLRAPLRHGDALRGADRPRRRASLGHRRPDRRRDPLRDVHGPARRVVKAPLVLLGAWAALGALYLVLAHALDAARVGFVLLSSGGHTPLWALAGAVLLVALRLVVVVLGPGVALAACGALAQKTLSKSMHRAASASLKA